jgi:hypothetical protein
MSETATLESIWRRLDGLQNNVSGVNRRMVTLESTLSDRMAALETRLAGLEECADQLGLPGEVKAAGIRWQLQAQLASVDRPAHAAIDLTREAIAERAGRADGTRYGEGTKRIAPGSGKTTLPAPRLQSARRATRSRSEKRRV